MGRICHFVSVCAEFALISNLDISSNSLQNGGFSAPRKGSHNDKAHPPIHPTAHAGNLTGDGKRVYEYITRRFLACCSKHAEGWETVVHVVCGGEFFETAGMVYRRCCDACLRPMLSFDLQAWSY